MTKMNAFILILVFLSFHLCFAYEDLSRVEFQTNLKVYDNKNAQTEKGSCPFYFSKFRWACIPCFKISFQNKNSSEVKSIVLKSSSDTPRNYINFLTDPEWNPKRKIRLDLEIEKLVLAQKEGLLYNMTIFDCSDDTEISKNLAYSGVFGFGQLNATKYTPVFKGFLDFEYRFVCQENYYTSYCNKFCKQSGHLLCDNDGNPFCEEGYLYPNCVEKDPCYSGPGKERPCLNGGACTPERGGTFSCSCLDGYFGDRCQNHTGTTTEPYTTTNESTTEPYTTTNESTTEPYTTTNESTTEVTITTTVNTSTQQTSITEASTSTTNGGSSTTTTAAFTTTEGSETTNSNPTTHTSTTEVPKPPVPKWSNMCPDKEACVVIITEKPFEPAEIIGKFNKSLQDYLNNRSRESCDGVSPRFQVQNVKITDLKSPKDNLQAISFEVFDTSQKKSLDVYAFLFQDEKAVKEFADQVIEKIGLQMYDSDEPPSPNHILVILGVILLIAFVISVGVFAYFISKKRRNNMRATVDSSASPLFQTTEDLN